MLTIRSGFTIVELIIVITVIGILASVGVTSYKGSLARGRDAARKSDVAHIADALGLYYVKNGNFIETGSGCGLNGNGQEYVNLSNGGTYPRSIVDCLKDSGFLKEGINEPKGSTTAYMKFHCDVGTPPTRRVYVFAKLETGPLGSTDPINAASNVCSNDTVDTTYGMNYYVEVQ